MKRKLDILKTGILLLMLTLSASAASALPDLQVSGMTVKHNTYTGAWANLSNTVNVTVLNNGTDSAGSFNVSLYADSILVDKKPVSGLAGGANSIVSFGWTPSAAQTYTLKAEADSDNAVTERNEANNIFNKSQQVLNNGYIGDKPMITYAHGTVKGDILFTHGTSSYSGELSPSGTYTVQHTVTLPAGATVKFARLYNYWTWSHQSTTGVYPEISMTFNGNTVSPNAKYDDKKGWGSNYNYPAGTWGYDVTSYVTGNGTYTSVVTNNGAGNFSMDGLGLLVVYEDPNGHTAEYWINEGADMISTVSSSSGGLTPEEATTSSLFSGPVSNATSARLWTVVQSGGDAGDSLLFNDMSWNGVYDATPYSDLDIDEARSVKDNLKASDNIVRIRAAPSPGDYLMPSNAFLVVNYDSGSVSPVLSVSATPTTVTVGTPTDVTFTVTSDSTKISGATVTLSGSATGSGTTDANGTTVISVNATGAGTITATASKSEYASGTTTITAEGGDTEPGVSSSVSLGAEIIPAVTLVVTPNTINFGELSPGETSSIQTLTMNNTGGYDISVTAEVNDTASNLFVNGVLLDSNAWNAYNVSIVSGGSKLAGASLKVPSDYASAGAKEGTLVFWAQKS